MLLPKQVDNYVGSTDKSAGHAAECLAHRAANNINLSKHTLSLWCASTSRSIEPGRVRVINDDECVILLGKFDDILQRREVSVH